MEEYSILDAESPTMVVRCNNTLVLRSIISGKHIEVLGPATNSIEAYVPAAVRQKNEQIQQEYIKAFNAMLSLIPYENEIKLPTPKPATVLPVLTKSPSEQSTELPPCKVQRNYCCTLCSFYTQNPRSHLLHQRDVHGVRLSIHSCQFCQYASRYCQKLKRHIKMVHTLGGLQHHVSKPENPNKEICKDTIDPAGTSKKIPPNTPKASPFVEQSPKTSVQLPVCSEPKTLVNPRIDPEAFFVSAYKNQLQIQLEYEQRLKKFIKRFDSDYNAEKTTTATVTQKNPIQSVNVDKSNTNSAVKIPQHITEENTVQKSVEIEKPRVFSCRKCNYITHIKSRYNKHVKYHSMPMIQCDKCEFRTTYKWNLTRHLRSHHSNGTYKCSVCTFSANMKQSLTSHEVNHHSPPVGRAVGSKLIRRRRCRVGGSDLQHPINDHTGSNQSSSISVKHEVANESGKDIFNSSASTSNENDQSHIHNNFQNPSNMDFSDSDTESSYSSDSELNGFDDGINPINDTTLTNAPIHVNADFLSENLRIDSMQQGNMPVCEQLFSKDKQISEHIPNEQNILQNCTNSGYTSESSISSSTISADEASGSRSPLESETSSHSTYSSIRKSSSSSSITSYDSSNPPLQIVTETLLE